MLFPEIKELLQLSHFESFGDIQNNVMTTGMISENYFH
jgi:hypothetical protein